MGRKVEGRGEREGKGGGRECKEGLVYEPLMGLIPGVIKRIPARWQHPPRLPWARRPSPSLDPCRL